MSHVWWDQTDLGAITPPATGWFSTADHGAVGDGVTDDTAALQATIDAAITAGGGIVWMGQGLYRLTTALTIAMPAATIGVQIHGSGTTTKLVQATSGADVFQVGQTGAEVADFVTIRDLWLSGGRYGLNLNNALRGNFRNLLIQGQTTGVYLQGQNESHTFDNLQIDNCSLHGIHGGVVNGGTGAVLDAPVVQKCAFRHIRVSGTVGGTAVLVTAGNLGGQQASGANRFEDLLFESNRQGSLALHYAFNTTIDGLSTEDSPDTNNTYASLLVDDQSVVTAKNLSLTKGSSNNFKYYLHVLSGTALVSDSILCSGGAAGTSDVYVAGTLSLTNCLITDASAIGFASSAAKQAVWLSGVRNSAGSFLAFTDTEVAYLSRSAGSLLAGPDFSAYTVSAALGGTAATSGAFRMRHAPSGGGLVGRDAANGADYVLVNWGTPDGNRLVIGNASIGVVFKSAFAAPSTLQDGDMWIDFTGTTPNRQLQINVRDGGVTYSQAIGALH